MSNPILPVISLNGTALPTLIDARGDVLEACRELAQKLHDMAPHPRDYVQSKLFEDAQLQHIRRVDLLYSLMREIEQERNLLCDRQWKTA